MKSCLIWSLDLSQAELRANVFAAIEEEDRAIENEENPTFALLGACNERAKELHASPTGVCYRSRTDNNMTG